MKKSRFFKSISILFIALYLLSGCEKASPESPENLQMDNTYYVADLHSILILCEDDGNPGYLEAIQLLKGDEASVMDGIEQLSAMDQTPEVMNAIGVGYLRLDRCEEAKEILNDALISSRSDSVDVCIVNNLGSTRLMELEGILYDEATLKYDHVLKKVTDPIQALIIRANRLCYGPFVNVYDDNREQMLVDEVNQLLEDERRLLGKNDIAGLYSYMALSYCGDEDERIQCYNQIFQLNQELHQYRAVDIFVYRGLTGSYYRKGDYPLALEYNEKWIQEAEGYLSEADSDSIKAYMDKGTLLTREKRYDEAIQCLDRLLESGVLNLARTALINLKLGEIYYNQDDFATAEELVEKALDTFKQGFWEWRFEDLDARTTLDAYTNIEYMRDDPDYMQWLQEQLAEKLEQEE